MSAQLIRRFIDRAGVRSAVVMTVLASIVVGVATRAVAHDDASPLQLLLHEHGDAWDSPARIAGGRREPERASVVAAAAGAGRAERRVGRRSIVALTARWHGGPAMTHAKEKALALATPRPGPSAGQSMYEDPTLRRGDAVMTMSGLRVFEGSDTFPYLRTDFSQLDASHSVRARLRKILMAYDHQVPLRREDVADLRDMTIRVHVPSSPHG